MKKMDVVIIIISFFLFIGSFFINNIISNIEYNQMQINIYSDNELYYTNIFDDNLNETIEMNTDLGQNTIIIENGEVHFHDADCPDQICVLDGEIGKAGEVLVCLPNKVLVEIVGNNESEVDIVTY